jgi:mannose-6-phosphate isomerase class I
MRKNEHKKATRESGWLRSACKERVWGEKVAKRLPHAFVGKLLQSMVHPMGEMWVVQGLG